MHGMRGMQAFVRTLIVGAAIAIAAAPQAIRQAHAQAAGKRVAVFMGPTQDKYLGTWSKTFADTAGGLGVKVTVFSSPFDPALQSQQIDDAIAQKYDALVVQTLSQKAVIPPLQRAKGAKIPVVLIVAPLVEPSGQDLYVSFVGYDHSQVGRIAGENMARALGRAGKVAIVAGSMAEGIAPIRADAFKAAVAKAGIEVVAIEDAKWNPANAERMAGQLLARFGAQGGLDGIYGMNDIMANGVIQAAEAAGVKFGNAKGQLIVVGGNCQAPGVNNLRAGKMYGSVTQLPVEEGKLAAARVKDMLDGKSLEKAIYIAPEAVTKDNLDKYSAPCSY